MKTESGCYTVKKEELLVLLYEFFFLIKFSIVLLYQTHNTNLNIDLESWQLRQKTWKKRRKVRKHYSVNILGSFSGVDNHVALVEIFTILTAYLIFLGPRVSCVIW